MPQLQKGWLVGFFSLALLLTDCQPASEPVPLPPQETAVSQAATVALPTTLPTSTNTPSPTVTPSPTATPTLARTSQGDQLPTRSPTSPPTPTAIPAEEPVPSTIATRPLPTPTLAPVGEVDLPALEESLVLLDRLDRRKGKPTPTPVGPIIFEGPEYITETSCPEVVGHAIGTGGITSVRVVLKVEGNNVSGIYDYVPNMSSNARAVNLPFAGTYNSLTGEITESAGCWTHTYSLQASLSEDGRKFEGSEEVNETCQSPYTLTWSCKTVYTFSLTRK